MSSADEPSDAEVPVPRSSGMIIGTLHQLKPESETFTVYMERVEIFFTVNHIPPTKMLLLLLTCIGSTTYSIVRK